MHKLFILIILFVLFLTSGFIGCGNDKPVQGSNEKEIEGLSKETKSNEKNDATQESTEHKDNSCQNLGIFNHSITSHDTCPKQKKEIVDSKPKQSSSPKTCPKGFGLESKKCLLNTNSCKMVTDYDEAEKNLKMKNQIWCGNLKGRFKSIKNEIYDQVLKGYWGQTERGRWQSANKNCQEAGKKSRLPTIHELISLIHPTEDQIEGHINPSFINTKGNFFWSSNPRSGKTDYYWRLDFSGGRAVGSYKSLFINYRCFRPN